MASILTIPEEKFNEVVTCLGWPIVQVEDWGLSKDQIKDLFILRTLKDIYYKWFPIINEQEYSITSTFEIDFPDDDTFGIVDARLVWKRAGYDTSSGTNPFVYGQAITVKSSVAGKSANMWDTGNDYGYSQVYEIEKAYNQSRIDATRGLKKRVDYTNRTLTGFTNVAGKLVVKWAKYSANWSGVQHRFEEDVTNLCQSRILEYFGRLLNMGTGNLPTELSGDDLIDKAESLSEEVMNKWKQYSKVVLMRG